MNQERRDQIIKMINENRVVKNQELMELFDISIETVRRDLKYLERQGYLERVYGGAVLKQDPMGMLQTSDAYRQNLAEKDAIAREAVKLVKRGETIFLEEGSTVLAMTNYLKDIMPLTVITNSLRIATVLSDMPDCTAILTGGRVVPGTLELTGFQDDGNLRMFNIDKAFIGVHGITETHFTEYSALERRYIRRQIIQDSSQAIVLADYSKFGVRATINMATIDELDIVITDDRTSDSYVRKLKKNGIQVIVAKVEEPDAETRDENRDGKGE